jgi:subfamily B ATP-binding cassette protein MsbA
MKNYRLGVYVHLIADTLPHIAWAVVIGFGGHQVIQGALSVGSLLAFANYLDRIYGPINGLSGIYSEMQKVVPAMERVAKILDTEPEFNTFKGKRLILDDIKGHIAFKSVGFGYLKEKQVIKNLNIEIKPNSKVAIVGPSGCGKTTLAHLLVRFFDVTSGSIYLDGINIKQINLPSYRRHVGLVPQGVRLFATSILENILMGNRRASEDEVIEAAKLANAHHFIEHLPDGYNTLYGEKGVWLSGGETQRIIIARAILQNPKVLILDEATSSVDANSEALIHDAINKAAIGKTLIVIAHRFSTIIDSDWIYVMENGQIIGQGTHQSLVVQNELYASLYSKQIQEGNRELVNSNEKN